MRRTLTGLALLIAFALSAPSAGAVPPPCQTFGEPQSHGMSLNHVYAKLNGVWVEPQGLCASLYYHEVPLGDVTRRFLKVDFYKAPGVAFNEIYDLAEVGIPKGTRMSVGVTLPAGSNPKFTEWKADNLIAGFADTSFAVQGDTTSGIREKGFGSGGAPPECTSRGTRMVASMFYGGFALQPLNADGSPSDALDVYAGSFFYSNAEFARVPQPGPDGGIVVPISNCGDGDPTNKEGFYGGYLNLPVFEHFDLSQDDLREGAPFIDELLRMRDTLANKGIDADFTVVERGFFEFEPIPGVTFPSLPTGPGPTGVHARGVFGYSSLDVTTESVEGRIDLLHKCQDAGGKLAERNGKLACLPEKRKPKVSLKVGSKISVSELRQGVTVSCNEPCKAKVQLLIAGDVAGGGRANAKEAGKFTVAVKLRRAVRRKLSGNVDALLRVAASDRAGNTRTVTRKLTLMP